MLFDPGAYGADVAAILALDGQGDRLMPLAGGQCSSPRAKTCLQAASPQILFSQSRSPEGAWAGLWLYFSCLDEAHGIAQDLHTSDGSFWHAIMHRQEPDAGNSSYWFHRVGRHPIFPLLLGATAAIAEGHPAARHFPLNREWQPLKFIDFCEQARRRPGSSEEDLAMRIQRAEWQLLFDHCARSRS